jgi:hypothetical protein
MVTALLACLAACSAASDVDGRGTDDVVDGAGGVVSGAASGTIDPAAGTGSDATAAGWRKATCADGTHTVAWRLLADGDVPRNRDFEIEVVVSAGGEPRSVEGLAVRGWMPDHNHGLVQLPSVVETDAGTYLVTGLLLHMRGRWELRFSFTGVEDVETISFELEL